MYYKNVADISVFLLFLLSFEPLYNAQNSDLVLNFDESGQVKVFPQPFSGQGLSVCTWLQLEVSELFYFTSTNPSTNAFLTVGLVDFNHQTISGASIKGGDPAFTNATDCTVKNEGWVHICITNDLSSINIYFNGYPFQNYTSREKFDASQTKYISFKIGDVFEYGGSNNIYQFNAFDRVITAKEAKDLHDCQSNPGDLVSWANITEKSLTFAGSVKLVQKPVPCPNPPKYQPINCETGEPIEQPGSDPGSSSGNPSSSSGNSNQNSGSGSGTPSSGGSDQSMGSGSGNPTSGGSDQSKGSGSGNPTSFSGNSGQSTGSGSGSPISSSSN